MSCNQKYFSRQDPGKKDFFFSKKRSFDFLFISGTGTASFFFLFFFSHGLFSQVFYNSGVTVILKNNAVIQVMGDASNNEGKINTEGNFNVTRNLTNNDTLSGNGKYLVGGDWINNHLYSTGSGTVELNGVNQAISGNTVTPFFNLTLTGTGKKSMSLNSLVAGTLSLNDRELATDTHIMYVINPGTNAITRTTGFVSSLGNGKLSRAVNSTGTYLFPVGSSAGTLRYRPVEIVPGNTAADTFRVRMANVDATSEGFNRSLADTFLCSINPAFYHRITHSTGSTPAGIRIFYDNATDGNFTNIAHWQNIPQWENTGVVSVTANPSPTLSFIANSAWSDFTYEPFALAGAGLLSNVTKTDLTCGSLNSGTATVSVSGGQAPYSFLWSNGQSDSTATALTAGTYYITSSDINSCTAVDSVIITGFAPLVPTLSSTNENCSSLDGTATASVTGGATPYSFLWSGGQNTATATGLAAGNYTVTITDFSGCDTTASVAVTGTGGATLSLSSSQPLCNGGNNGSATVSATGGTSPYSYLWNDPQAQTTGTATGLFAGNYIVSVTDSSGCLSIDSVTVADPSALTIATTGTNVPCNGTGSGTATASLSGGSSPFSFAWSNGQSDSTATGLASGTYYVTATDINGCTAVDSVAISGSSSMILTLNATDENCSQSNGTATVSVSGGTTPYSYLWPGGQTSAIATGLAAGNYTVTVTDFTSCDTTATVTVNGTGGATVTASFTPPSCNGGNNGSATATCTGGTTPYSFLWNDSQAQTSNPATGLGAGNFSVTVTDNNGCASIASVTITEPPSLSAGASGTDISCNGAADGSAAATASGGSTPYSFLWSNGQSTPAISGLSAGSYSVTVSDSNNCISADSLTITEPSPISLSVSGNTSICAGTSTSLYANAPGAILYFWNTGDSSFSITVSPAADTVYSVTAFVGSCTATQQVPVTVSLPPTASISGTSAVCRGDSAVLTATGGPAYVWSTGDSTQTITVTPSSTTSYSVSITNSCGTATSSFSVTLFASPAANAGNDTTISKGSSVSLNATGGVNYQWNNSPDLSCTNCQNPVATPAAEATYYVTVTDANGCTATDSVKISVSELDAVVYLPNIFSPNGDGENEILFVMGEQIEQVRLRIFDRWGEQVFETLCCCNEACGWDGNFRGKKMNPAAFVYIIEGTFSDGTPFNNKGNLMLVR